VLRNFAKLREQTFSTMYVLLTNIALAPITSDLNNELFVIHSCTAKTLVRKEKTEKPAALSAASLPVKAPVRKSETPKYSTPSGQKLGMISHHAAAQSIFLRSDCNARLRGNGEVS
jgi:hypothetical protein